MLISIITIRYRVFVRVYDAVKSFQRNECVFMASADALKMGWSSSNKWQLQHINYLSSKITTSGILKNASR